MTTTITPTGSARVRRAVEWLVVGTGGNGAAGIVIVRYPFA